MSSQSPLGVELDRLRKENESLRAQLAYPSINSSNCAKCTNCVSCSHSQTCRSQSPDAESISQNQQPEKPSSAYKISVCTSLVTNLPESIQFGTKHKPCAVFVVTNGNTGEVCWYFMKSYGQLCAFDESIRKTLLPLMRTGDFIPRMLPPKEMFTVCTPWKVDVRNDMLNAYFATLFGLKNVPVYNKRVEIQSRVQQVLAALWLQDIVHAEKLPLSSLKPTLSLPVSNASSIPFSGCLLVPEKSGWSCNYCYIENTDLKVIEESRCRASVRNVSLKNAKLTSVVVFFDTTEDDHRYLFEISDKKHTNRFIAENQKMRTEWLQALAQRIYEINQGAIHSSHLRCPTLKELLPPFVLSNPESEDMGKRPSNFLLRQASSSSIPSMESTNNGSRYSVYDELNNDDPNDESSDEKARLYDGDEFYMQISKNISNGSNDTLGSRHKEKKSKSHISNLKISEPKHAPLPCEKGVGVITPVTVAQFDNSLRRQSPMNIRPGMSGLRTSSTKLVFGVPPHQCKFLISLNKDLKVPSVLYRCVQSLMRTEALYEMGIFRKSGSQKLITDLQEKFDTLGDLDLVKTHVDVHTTADLMKRYLRSLPRNSFGDWSERNSERLLEFDKHKQLEFMKVSIHKLPEIQHDIFCTTLRLLGRVNEYRQYNNMNTKNLGLALSPAMCMPGPVLQTFIERENEL